LLDNHCTCQLRYDDQEKSHARAVARINSTLFPSCQVSLIRFNRIWFPIMKQLINISCESCWCQRIVISILLVTRCKLAESTALVSDRIAGTYRIQIIYSLYFLSVEPQIVITTTAHLYMCSHEIDRDLLDRTKGCASGAMCSILHLATRRFHRK